MNFFKLALVALSFGAMSLQSAHAAGPFPQFSVTGTGRVAQAPDMATITLGVAEQRPTAADAMRDMNAAALGIFGSLKAFEIAPRDMQTSQLLLAPQWERYKLRSGGEGNKITSYIASNMVTIRVRDLDQLGAILDSVTAGGANRFNGLTFGFETPGPLMDQAREAAMQDAMRKARQMADATGVELGRVLAMSEASSRPQIDALQDGAMRRSTPVAAGEVGISASFTITYEMLN